MQDMKLKEFMVNHRKDWTLVMVTIVSTGLLVVGLNFIPSLTSRINSADTHVPDEFLSARRRAGDAANRISELTDTYRDSIEKISEAERDGNFNVGLDLIVDEVNKNEEVRRAAEDLSLELSEMARYIDAVDPEKASTVALSAVTTGIELVQHLISYNNTTRDLLNVLQSRFRTGDDEETRVRIDGLITEMNSQADTINNLGSEYRGLMLQFDGLTD